MVGLVSGLVSISERIENGEGRVIYYAQECRGNGDERR